MSTDAPPQQIDWLAIAFLVEASLTLSYEWNRLFQDYIVHLLQRCSIALGPNKLTRVAFITYGTADTQPSPIVKKIYFTELRYILQDIKDDHRRLGIGQTDSGGDKGMAALEGFATVLDVCPNRFPSSCSWSLVVHIAASPPDSSEHPHWNQSPLLDSLTWDLLPAEFKRRNIQLSGINIISGLPRFPELYTQAAAGSPTTPWFNVKTQHHLFINGFAVVQPKVKRAGEPVAPDRSPEAKRPRVAAIQPAAESSTPNTLGQTPPAAQPATSASPAASSSTMAPVTQPPPQPNSQAGPQVNAPNPLTILPQVRQQIMHQAQLMLAQRKRIEDETKLLQARRQLAMSQGNAQLVSLCDAEINKRKENFSKLSQALAALHQQARRVQAGPQNTAPQAPEAQASSPPKPNPTPNPTAPPMARAVTSPSALATKDPQTPFNANTATTPRQTPGVQSPNINPKVTPARSISASGVPAPTPPNPPTNPPTNPPPSMMSSAVASANGLNAQTQKLLQLDRNRQAPLVQSVLVWEGTLTFNGTGSDGNKKEVHTRVSASSSNAGNSHSGTWPSSMTLVPAMTPAVSIPEFQDWIRRTKPVLCTFKARSPEDETNYQMLVSVMSTKRMYATASWALPNGSQKENVLIFPINNMGLCGAFFPLTGIPEMPKSTAQVPPAIFGLIQQLPPEQRAAAIAQIRQKVAAGPEVAAPFFRALLQRQQQNAQNRAVMANQFGLNPMTQPGAMAGGPNVMGMMNMNPMNKGAVGGNPLSGMGNLSTMLPNMARPGGAGGSGGMNLNYDVLQSFMQRNNPDGNNTGGMGGMGSS
ncbi:hypothetical protein AN958_12312 [Leucoagaricus sp. SymC.cos]|nr:hypothetical protein AN958_12312 [Leucoagaricus sp. SymC.cos]